MLIGQKQDVRKMTDIDRTGYFYRMDNTQDGADKTYRLTLRKNEFNQWELIGAWGRRTAKSLRRQTKAVGSFAACKKKAWQIIDQKADKGYVATDAFGGASAVWPGGYTK